MIENENLIQPIHAAYSRTYWANQGNPEFNTSEIILARNKIAEKMALEPCGCPISIRITKVGYWLRMNCDHLEFYKIKKNRIVVMMFHEYHTSKSRVDRWVGMGWQIMPSRIYHRNATSFWIVGLNWRCLHRGLGCAIGIANPLGLR
jgi:hypothetical protein